jgi:hypothetical protein
MDPNRAHIEKSGVKNRMSDMPAGGGAAVARPANDLPPPLRGNAPETLGPHDYGRHVADNASTPTMVGVHTGPVTPTDGRPAEQWDRK